MRARVSTKANADVEEAGSRAVGANAQSETCTPGKVAGAEDRAVDPIVTVILRRPNVHLAHEVRQARRGKSVGPHRAFKGRHLWTEVERVHLVLTHGIGDVGGTDVAPEVVIFGHVDVSRDVPVGDES